ncbi:hypothetical protein A2U01_0107107, partial [Trifolium medium]|nr:hypothetical protein [Trifolium medium]
MRMMDNVSKRDGDLVEGSLNDENRCRKENLTTKKFEGGSEIHGGKRKNKRCNEKMREEEEAIKW